MTSITKKSSRTRLTAKQEAFCVNYFIMRNATQAAIKAGYSLRTAQQIGAENLLKPLIIARRNELEAAVAKEAIANVEERQKKLTEVIRETYRTPVMARDRVSAIAEMNKMGGDYAPEKHAILGDIVIEVVYRDRKQLEEGDK